jgi:hypothetical protein
MSGGPCGIAEHGPVDIRAKILAANGAGSSTLYRRAVFRRDRLSLPPVRDGALNDTALRRESGLTSDDADCAVEVFHGRI